MKIYSPVTNYLLRFFMLCEVVMVFEGQSTHVLAIARPWDNIDSIMKRKVLFSWKTK